MFILPSAHFRIRPPVQTIETALYPEPPTICTLVGPWMDFRYLWHEFFLWGVEAVFQQSWTWWEAGRISVGRLVEALDEAPIEAVNDA